jgi:hypothetical protein
MKKLSRDEADLDKVMNCNVFKRSLYHFQADELPAAERAVCQEHLNACVSCAALLEVEDGLLRGLKTRLTRVPAPPGLETRIRAQLRQAGRWGRPAVGWVRKPWFAALAASLLLAVLLFPSGESLESPPVPSGSSEYVTRVVTVVDFHCDSAGRSYEQQRQCPDPAHLNALKLDDGGYWHVSLDHEVGHELVTDRRLRGTRMRVEGLLYESIRTLQLDRAEKVGDETAKLVSSPL